MSATTWTFEGYWNAALGDKRSPRQVVDEFDLEGGSERELDEWLGEAQEAARSAGGAERVPGGVVRASRSRAAHARGRRGGGAIVSRPEWATWPEAAGLSEEQVAALDAACLEAESRGLDVFLPVGNLSECANALDEAGAEDLAARIRAVAS